MQKILIPLADGFEEIEFTTIVDVLRRLDFNVTVASISEKHVTGSHGIILHADVLLADVDATQFDALILPGGIASFTLKETQSVLDIIRERYNAGALIGAICAAPIALSAAGILQGKKIAAYPAVRERLTSEGAIVQEDAVVRDGTIITGDSASAALEFSFALGSAFLTQERIEALQDEMCYRGS